MTIRWALAQLRYHKLLMAVAIVFGSLTILSSVSLMSMSGYLISRAAHRPENKFGMDAVFKFRDGRLTERS